MRVWRLRQIKIWVRDPQPVCVEEPLTAVLDEMRQRIDARRDKRKRKTALKIALIVLFLLIFPVLSYLTGRGLEAAGMPGGTGFWVCSFSLT